MNAVVRFLLGSVAAAAVLACGADPRAGAQNIGQGGAAIVLSWSRDGGIAGFCDQLQVTAAGEVTAKSCKTPGALTRKLSPDEAKRFEQMRRQFGSVAVTSTDQATADAMKQTLTFAGTGTGQPSETQRQDLLDWAQRVYASTIK